LPDFVVPDLTREEEEILAIPVEELSKEQLFSKVRLAARLSKGVDYVLELAKRQRSVLTEEAAAAEDGRLPVETRVELDAYRSVRIEFTEEIVFPEGYSDRIKNEVGRRRLSRHKTKQKDFKKDKEKDKDKEGEQEYYMEE